MACDVSKQSYNDAKMRIKMIWAVGSQRSPDVCKPVNPLSD